ncbi:MAG: GAF domain-containing protein [Anaerolineales bacterium]|nr:GAF domain-containing protein [Anaerolineales bacterium]
MSDSNEAQSSPRVIVIADVESNASALIERILSPAGIQAWIPSQEAPPADIIIVDVTQLRGDPLADLREIRAQGEDAPAIVLAAHFPHSRLRDMFRLGVNDFLLKPYRPQALCQAVLELSESRSTEADTQILARRLETIREQLRRRSEEIRLLSEIGRVVVGLGDLDSILRRVVEAAAFMTDAEEASIYIAEPGTNELVLRATKSVGDRHATLQRLRVEDTLVGEVFATGQPILRQPSLGSGPIKVQTGFMVQSLAKVPLRMRNNVVGVLGIYNGITPRRFNEHHLTLLMALGHWAGVALEYASMMREATSPSTSKTLTAAPPNLIDGLDHAIQTLEPVLRGLMGSLSDSQNQALNELLEQLNSLRALPVAELDVEEVQEMVDLPNLLEQVVEDMRRQATRRGLELIVENSPPMPLFRGDSSRTQRVIETLVSAAIRRTSRGRIVLEGHRLEVRQGRSSGLNIPRNIELKDGLWAIVRISDTSPGLSPDTIHAITKTEVDPSSGQIGPGLSLGEIRMILESMGGKMWYEHTPASTTIVFSLPIT